MNALAKLEPVDLNHDLAVGADVDERVWWERLGLLLWRGLRISFLGQSVTRCEVEGNEQAAGCGKRHAQKAAPVEIRSSQLLRLGILFGLFVSFGGTAFRCLR